MGCLRCNPSSRLTERRRHNGVPSGKIVTKEEAIAWAEAAKWIASDLGQGHAAGVLEDVAIFLACTTGLTCDMCRARADFIVAPGRRGRVTLVLSSRPCARILAFAAALLREVEV